MIKTGSPVISIYTEMTPNPETMKFVANKLLYPGKSIDFQEVENAKPSPLATELFGFPFIKAVFIASNFVTLTKTPDTEWNDVIPSVRTFLKEYLEDGKTVVNEDEIAVMKQESSNTVAADDDDVVKRIKELLENYVKPAVEMDGGAIQFRSYDDGVVNLMLQGSCSGCPSSSELCNADTAIPAASRAAPPVWSLSRWLSISTSMRDSPRARSSGSSTRCPASLSAP